MWLDQTFLLRAERMALRPARTKMNGTICRRFPVDFFPLGTRALAITNSATLSTIGNWHYVLEPVFIFFV